MTSKIATMVVLFGVVLMAQVMIEVSGQDEFVPFWFKAGKARSDELCLTKAKKLGAKWNKNLGVYFDNPGPIYVNNWIIQ